MPAVSRLLACVLGLVAAPAIAVGLGPLTRSGVTDGPGKAFYLTVSNPYRTTERFSVQPLGLADEMPVSRVLVFPADPTIAPGRSRKLLVIVRPLEPGETYSFRVCAERAPRPEETIHARVCSKLTARRLRARA